jgi:hypothetical protein
MPDTRKTSRPTNTYGRMKRGLTNTNLSGPKRGSKPPGTSIAVRKRGRR